MEEFYIPRFTINVYLRKNARIYTRGEDEGNKEDGHVFVYSHLRSEMYLKKKGCPILFFPIWKQHTLDGIEK